MSILGFLFFFIIAILLLGLSVISSILRALFGFGKRKNPRNGQSQSNSQNSSRQSTKDTVQDAGAKRKKYFDDSEGEYVDFEEVNDNEK